jgi:hypothetical protein
LVLHRSSSFFARYRKSFVGDNTCNDYRIIEQVTISWRFDAPNRKTLANPRYDP